MGTLNLGGSATYSGNSTGLTQAPPGTIISQVSINKKGCLWGIKFFISSIFNFIFLNYF